MKTTVAFLFGGRSVEHEVSVISALQAFHALDESKYNKLAVYVTKDGRWFTGEKICDVSNYKNLETLFSQSDEVYMRPKQGDHNLYFINEKKGLFKKAAPIAIDVILPIFHGSHGEDGCMQGLFELLDIPYGSSPVTASAVAMDKAIMKGVFREAGLPVIDGTWTHIDEYKQDSKAVLEQITSKVSFPCIVKPALLGSSVGIKTAKNKEELEEALSFSFSFCPKVVIEKYFSNMFEINCSVRGRIGALKASVLERPLSNGEILNFKDKYEREDSAKGGMQSMDRIIPADISQELAASISEMAIKAFREIGCAGVSRIDFIVDKDSNTAYVNELNSIPGSLSFYLWDKTETPFPLLLEGMIETALHNYRLKQNTLYSHDTNLFQIHGKGGGTKGGSKQRAA